MSVQTTTHLNFRGDAREALNDIPGRTEGGIAGGVATHRQNNTTVTDQTVFLSISSPTLDSSSATGTPSRWMPQSSSRWPRRRGARVSAY